QRIEVSRSEGDCMVCRFCDTEFLGVILSRFAKSAELAEAHDQAMATENRCGRVASELVIDPVRGQRREVVLGKVNYPLIFGESVVHLLKVAGGQNAEIQVAQDSRDCMRLGPAPPGLVELVEQYVGVHRKSTDPSPPAVVVQLFGQCLSFAYSLQVLPKLTEL